MDAYAVSDPMVQAVRDGHRQTVMRLIRAGSRVNRPVRHIDALYHLLHIAVERGDRDMAALLLDRKANVEAVETGQGETALSLACNTGHFVIARLLVDRGAVVNHVAIDGATPLYNASKRGHLDIARLMLDRGAVVDAPKHTGFTPLWSACFNGHFSIAHLLMD